MSKESAIVGVLSEAEQDRLARILDDYLVALERGSSLTPAAFLDRHPADAEHLRAYLSGLQLFHQAVFFEHERPAAAIFPDQETARCIGDFRLVREIGRGGMGVVYEAWQESLHRRVALKVLPFTATNDAKQISRFKNEAQAAAQVQHPNIVPIHAVGEANGMHYYAMQLIEGQSLNSLLEAIRSGHFLACGTTAPKRISTLKENADAACHSVQTTNETHREPFTSNQTGDHIRAVARLGIQAAEALYAAHEYGVLHRDVKPSNLLVDDHGKLWITDFGLARCRDSAGLTQSGDILGTMRYMSPEQAQGRAASIDHRTDIYSLGVTLYELATLHHPAEGAGELRFFLDHARRGTKTLRYWNRCIPVDFQTIVLKAMAETSHERYGSAQVLADDLARFLDGKPILACPPSMLTRASKWLRRHRRAAISTAATLFVALTAILLVLARSKSQTEHALVQANDSLQQTQAVVARLTDLGDQLAPIPGADGVRQQLLEDCLGYYHRLEVMDVDDPKLLTDKAVVYSKLGSLSDQLGDKQQAIAEYQAAIEIWEERVARAPANAQSARNLTLCQNNLGLLLLESNASRSVDVLRTALATQRELLSAAPRSLEAAADVGATHSNLGLVYINTGQTRAAVQEFNDAISILEPLANLPQASEAVLRTLAASYNNLASLHNAQDSKLPAKCYQSAISIQLRLVKSHPINRLYQGDLARSYNNLGYLLVGDKEWKRAERCYADAIEIHQHLVKSSPLAGAYVRDLAISYNNLGMVQSRHGRLAQAESSFREAVRLQQTLLAAHPNDGQTLSNQGSVHNNLGMSFETQKRFVEAEEAFRRAVYYQGKAYATSPANSRLRALLSKHYHSLMVNLSRQAKHAEAVEVALEMKKLWAGQPEQLFLMAQELTESYERLSDAGDASSKAQYASAIVATLRDAFDGGLSVNRLAADQFASFHNNKAFRSLITHAER